MTLLPLILIFFLFWLLFKIKDMSIDRGLNPITWISLGGILTPLLTILILLFFKKKDIDEVFLVDKKIKHRFTPLIWIPIWLSYPYFFDSSEINSESSSFSNETVNNFDGYRVSNHLESYLVQTNGILDVYLNYDETLSEFLTNRKETDFNKNKYELEYVNERLWDLKNSISLSLSNNTLSEKEKLFVKDSFYHM